MLSQSFDLVEGLIEISYQRKWLETCIATIRFNQCLVQALWTSSHSLEQLPHFGEQVSILQCESLSTPYSIQSTIYQSIRRSRLSQKEQSRRRSLFGTT